MPPSRPRAQPDDATSTASSTKEKAAPTSATAPNGKRRVAANTATGSSLRDVVTSGQANSASNTTAGNQETPGINWSSVDADILHGYRYDYRLNTSAAFNKPANQSVLTQSPLGRMSPTMARHRHLRRQSKEQLANSVRKHFNSSAVAENEVVVDFLYKVRWQDKNFRMRFAPPRPR